MEASWCLGRFFHRVAMSVHVCVCVSPSHAIFFKTSHWPSGHMIRSRPLIGRGGGRPSYYTRGALRTRGGCRASIAHASIGHASILLHAWIPKNEGRVQSAIAHAWSPKNRGWVQSVHCPRVEPLRGRVDASAPHF